MALFDKLKEKVGKVVDIDKLKDQVNKTTDSIKKEVAKVTDPSVREQERLEREKALQEQKEQQRIEKEKAIEAFWTSNNLDETLNSIFTVLEKSDATASNFEKGLDHFFSKVETTLSKEDVFPAMKKALLVRAFDSDNCAVAKAVAADYFIQDVVKGEMLTLYMRFAIAKEKGDFSGWMPSFVKALYGIAGHAFIYQCNRANPENYQAITPDEFKIIIEHSDVLKSYTDSDPFTVDTVRENWAKDMYESPLKMVCSSKLGSVLNNEKYIDEMCYLAYTILRKDQENSIENVSVSEIAVAYNDFLKEIYDGING